MFEELIEPRHDISNNVVCATSKGSDQPAHTRGLIGAFASRLNIILSLRHLEFLVRKGSSESTLVKMPHCWKSHVAAQFVKDKTVLSHFLYLQPEFRSRRRVTLSLWH